MTLRVKILTYFNLEKLMQLTLSAMEKIDSNYWQKCISHMLKEVDYYLELNGITSPPEVKKCVESIVIKSNNSLSTPSNEPVPSTSTSKSEVCIRFSHRC